jgi:hypothetical protein
MGPQTEIDFIFSSERWALYQGSDKIKESNKQTPICPYYVGGWNMDIDPKCGR